MTRWVLSDSPQLSHSLSFWTAAVLLFALLWPSVTMGVEGKFCGKYQGSAVNVVDPLLRGRVQVQVPSVLGEGVSLWALPDVPFGRVELPEVGDLVWVEFEACDPNLPIWEGSPVVECGVHRNGAPRNCKTGH